MGERDQPERRFVPGKADTAMLEAVLRFHCVTATQVTKLVYNTLGALTKVQTRLKRLTEADYLLRDPILERKVSGHVTPYYYTLGRAGMRHLARLGHEVPSQARPNRVTGWKYAHVAHLLAVNEALIAAERLTRAYPVIKLPRLLHDLDLKRSPIRVELADGTRPTVVPDGFLDFEVHVEEGYRLPACLEVDLGSENQATFRKKVRALLAFSRGPFQKAFDRQAVTILVIATGGVAHRDRLVRWTEAELQSLAVADEELDLFRFATFPLGWDMAEAERPTPEQIYLEPAWVRPFDATPEPLLEGIE